MEVISNELPVVEVEKVCVLPVCPLRLVIPPPATPHEPMPSVPALLVVTQELAVVVANPVIVALPFTWNIDAVVVALAPTTTIVEVETVRIARVLPPK